MSKIIEHTFTADGDKPLGGMNGKFSVDVSGDFGTPSGTLKVQARRGSGNYKDITDLSFTAESFTNFELNGEVNLNLAGATAPNLTIRIGRIDA